MIVLDGFLRKRIFIVHNPASGTFGRRRLDGVLARLLQAGAQVEEIRTSSHGEGQERAHEAASSGRYDLIVAAGGDGTVHDVACGLVGGECPLGVIPMGTGNVFARELGLDFSPTALAGTLLSGPVRTIPLGEINGEPFLFVVGVGFDAAAVRFFEAANHRWLGRAGFVWPVLRALASAPAGALRIDVDDQRHEAHWVIVTRVKHYVANIVLAPEAALHDERLHVVLFNGAGVLARMRQLAAMLTGRLGDARDVTVIPARRVLVTGNAQTPVQVDGEAEGPLPLRLGIHSRRLAVVFPPCIPGRHGIEA